MYRQELLFKMIKATSVFLTNLITNVIGILITAGLLLAAGGFTGDAASAVSTGTVTRLPIITGIGAILLEQGGETVLVNEGVAISRFNLNSRSVQTVVSNLDRFIGPGLVMEAGGEAVLTFVSGGCGACPGELVRVILATGEIISVAGGLTRPQALVLEPGGASVLVTQGGTGLLSRIDLSTGVVTTVASGLGTSDAFPHGIALEPNGRTALVASMEGGGWGPRNGILYRVDLTTGAVSVVSRVGIWMTDVVLEAGGTTAIAVVQGGCCQGDIFRIDLASGVATRIYSTGDPGIGSNFLSELALEPGGSTVLTIAGGTNFLSSNALLRVDLNAVQSSQTLTYAVPPRWVTVEPNGSKVLLSAGSGLFRADLETGRVDLITPANASAEQIAIETTGTTGILAYRDYFGAGGLLRVDLLTNSVSLIASFRRGEGPVFPAGMALEPSGLTALVADQEGGSGGTLWRVNLANGAASAIASGFSGLTGVAIDSTGQAALVTAGSGDPTTNGIYRVDLSTGRVTLVVLDPNIFRGPRGIVIEADGTTALFTAAIGSSNTGQYGLFRLDLLTGQVTLIASLPTSTAQGIALEQGGTAVLIAASNHFLRVTFGPPDADNDGMPDAWELEHGLNPNDSLDAGLDPDGDGLINLQEFQAGTDPHNPDTDGDGFTDGEEINATPRTNPLDPTSHPPVAVILVHGINSNAGAFSDDGGLYRKLPDGSYQPCTDYTDPACLPWMGHRLAAELPADRFTLAQPFDYRDKTGLVETEWTIEQLAGELHKHIECVLRGDCISPRGATPAKVDIVAHSMGGLITRAYLADMAREKSNADRPIPYMSKKIRRLIMAGTPNYGSEFADLCPDFLNIQCEQMGWGSNFVWSLHERWRNMVLPERRILPEHLLVIAGTGVGIGNVVVEGDSDTIVNVASAALPEEFLPGDHLRYALYKHRGGLVAVPREGTHVTLSQVLFFLRDGSTPEFYRPSAWILDDGLFLVRLANRKTQLPVSPHPINPIDLTGDVERNPKAGTITVINLPQANPGYRFTILPEDGLGYIVPPRDSFNTGVIAGARPTVHTPIELDPGADLIVPSLSGPTEVRPARRIRVSIVGAVKNQGTVKAGSLLVPWSVALVLSNDLSITGDDTGLGSLQAPPLEAGQEAPIVASLQFTTPSTPACYFWGAIADNSSAIAESSEDNNTNSSALRVAEPLKIAHDRRNRPPTIGIPYNFRLGIIGGIAPRIWTLDAGELPPGLALTTEGVIFGTPTTRGTFSFTVRVTDGPEGGPCPRKTDTQRFTMTVR